MSSVFKKLQKKNKLSESKMYLEEDLRPDDAKKQRVEESSSEDSSEGS